MIGVRCRPQSRRRRREGGVLAGAGALESSAGVHCFGRRCAAALVLVACVRWCWCCYSRIAFAHIRPCVRCWWGTRGYVHAAANTRCTPPLGFPVRDAPWYLYEAAEEKCPREAPWETRAGQPGCEKSTELEKGRSDHNSEHSEGFGSLNSQGAHGTGTGW